MTSNAPGPRPSPARAGPRRRRLSRFGWRVTLVQFLSNALLIAVLILVLPGFELHAKHELLAILWLAVVFGVVTAVVRPVLEFLFLPYVLQTLGLVMVAINAIVLALLALTSVLEVRGVVALLVGAVVMGAVGFFLDAVLGLTPPVAEDASAALSRGGAGTMIAAVSERLRVMQLYGILVQYGVEFTFDWSWLRPFRRRMQEWLWRVPVPAKRLAPQVKARLLLQDLGPTYVKLGQIVSSQGRALPLEWEQELAKLQSDVRPFPYEDVRIVVAGSLGAPPETLYREFDPQPLAAASLAQVHEATTQDGRRVAVKVQRPNIHEQLRSDVTLLARGAAVLERRATWAADSGLTGVVEEFGSTLLRELDYTIEAYNTRRLARVLAPIEGVHVPAVEPTLSSDRVLTLEFVEGVKATATADIDAAGLDRQELARNLVRSAVQMVMIHGFFHADPHPGNVLVDVGTGRLTFLDAGMVGELDLRRRLSFVRFLLAFRDQDVASLGAILRSLSQPFREPDDVGYSRQFEQRVGPLIDVADGHRASLEKLAAEALDVLRGAGYRLDPQLTLAVKTLAQAEEITAALTPESGAGDFASLGGAALEELVPEALAGDTVAEAGRRQAIRAAGAVVDSLPAAQDAAAKWADQLRKGEIPVRVHLADLDRAPAGLEAIPRLIAVAILLAGLLVASALAASIPTRGSGLRSDLSDVGLILYVVAAAIAVALAAALLWRLLRPSGRRGRRQA
jgi:ubiquinone biosynthesis protein